MPSSPLPFSPQQFHRPPASTTQVWFPPAAICSMATRFCWIGAVGRLRVVVVLSPICPPALLPQHLMVVPVSAQEWFRPALICVTLSSPLTRPRAFGVQQGVPSPRCPRSLAPIHATFPLPSST